MISAATAQKMTWFVDKAINRAVEIKADWIASTVFSLDACMGFSSATNGHGFMIAVLGGVVSLGQVAFFDEIVWNFARNDK